MSESLTNGHDPKAPSLILSSRPLGKAHDFVTTAQAQQLIVEECTKVHEWYLQQIPAYVAGMIQDALQHYGLITPAPAPTAETPARPDTIPEAVPE